MKHRILYIALALGVNLTVALLWLLGGASSPVTAASNQPAADLNPLALAPPVPLALPVPLAQPQAELHVCLSGCLYDNLQAAVDAASEGSLIKVAQGTYTGVSYRDGVTQTVYLSKTLAIQGGYTTSDWDKPEPDVNLTTLDAQGQGRVFYTKGGITPTIAGLHLTGGNAHGLEPEEKGGGIYTYNEAYVGAYNTTFKDNHIYGNTAFNGGGAYLDGHSHYTLIGNTFELNTAEDQGGGMIIFNNAITLTQNTITGNSAGRGGGLAVLNADALLYGNFITDNHAPDEGGGLYVVNSAFKSEADAILKNSAGRGGGLAIFGVLYNQTWRENWMVNTVIAYNECAVEGSGIYIGGSPLHLWHTTLVNNIHGGGPGTGIHIGDWNTDQTSEVELRNTIVATQTVGIEVGDGSTVDIDSILWFGDAITLTQVPQADVSLVNEFTGDPAFADPVLADFHLLSTSAARDTGMVSGTPKDMDGLVRPMGFGYDLGAYEHADAALSLSKTPDRSGANVGEQLIYTLILTSSGVGDNHNVVLTDTLDAWQRPTAVASLEGNCTIEDPGWGGRLLCSPGNLNIGDSIEIDLTVEISTTPPLGQALVNTLSARADKAANSLQATLYAQDCHVRIGNNATEYTSVQAAVDAAYPYALVKVAGTCMGVYGPEGARQQVYLDRVLTIQGGYTTSNWTAPDPEANITTLDARSLGRVLYIYTSGELGAVVDGLSMTGGNAYGQIGGHNPIQREQASGGGVYIFGSDPTLSNNHIFGNTSVQGGGMYTSFCNLSLHGNTFTANTTIGDGGGLLVHAGGAILSDNLFDSNSAQNGGGFATSFGGGNFTRDTFSGNHASKFGGGLALETTAFLNETRILSNTAQYGGGISFFEGLNPNSPYAVLTNTVIADNHASLQGAGVFIPSGGAVHLLHTTLARNTGGDGSGVILGWYAGQQAGVSTVAMTDTILAYQSVGIRVTDASNLTVNGVLWFADAVKVSQSISSTVVVLNEHNGDPLFVNPDAGDYHIGEGSAAHDLGVPSAVTWDLDGELRPMGAGWDLGADEFFEAKWTYLPLMQRP